MEENVLTIENGVVTKCDKSAVNVVIPDGVTKIGQKAFDYCKSLLSVEIPKSVTEIGACAFGNCKSLKSAEIPEGVTKIDFGTFILCESLKSVRIPSSVTEIGTGAFEWCFSLSSVTIPEGVSTIKKSAFESCSSLKSISLPSTLTEIGYHAFDSCEAVESITSASPLFPFCEKNGTLCDANGNEILLTAKEINKRKKISEVQAAGASAVLDAILQEHRVADVRAMKETDECFLAVPAIDGGLELELPNEDVSKWMQSLPVFLDMANGNASTKELREYAKENDLQEIRAECYMSISDNIFHELWLNADPVYLTIPDGVTKIEAHACKGYDSLRRVEIPESVTKIENHAFFGCLSLSSIVFGGTIEEWKNVEKGEKWGAGVRAKDVECSDGKFQL